ncbi:type III pantothenate kinase [Mucilaginibacter sp. Bleaf8]|uniref:type III pantothenate kinase n=1 Tax=Mucilaginibacter sp. Bleaf8 TaxID=2834430 RepID=UPI001BCF9845|nr:type III pantothenate kinase [Mucilaginibacter sp. Bleaf8]MBS7566574.1 type III pantothenate kinase [Mucilaginibacter sp. Bleaf8]
MAQLVIDIGNTFTKLAVFNGNELLFAEHYEAPDGELLQSLINQYTIQKAIVSSVKKDVPLWLVSLQERVKVMLFSRDMATGIRNHYRTPHTLGLDRLVGVMSARHLYPGTYNLVIDAGTCITYDGVDAEGNYFGGSISPGLNMRYRAMNHYTAGLPLVQADELFNRLYGDDTLTAMQSGVQNGMLYEVQGFIQSYLQQAGSLNIILTGGDAVFLDTVLKNSIFAGYIKLEPYLVLKGLNAAIQEHND